MLFLRCQIESDVAVSLLGCTIAEACPKLANQQTPSPNIYSGHPSPPTQSKNGGGLRSAAKLGQAPVEALAGLIQQCSPKQ